MHKSPEPVESGASFELADVERELRAEPQYINTGHATRTLVRTDDLRVLLSVLGAGHSIKEHSAAGTVSIHVTTGQLRITLPSRTVDARSGQLLVLQAAMRHEVMAVSDSAFVLTLAWPGETAD